MGCESPGDAGCPFAGALPFAQWSVPGPHLPLGTVSAG